MTSTSLVRSARLLLSVAVTAALAASLLGTANGQEGDVRTKVEPQAEPVPAAAATMKTCVLVRSEPITTWQLWWESNQDRFRPVRGLRPSDPTAEEVAERIVPVLKSVLDEDDADIVDSAVLALGRVVSRDAAETCSAEIEHALGSRHPSVRRSAILALGTLGAEDGLPVLAGILEDRGSVNPSLRVDGVVPEIERGFAAIALGIVGAPESIPVLERVITAPPQLAQSVRAAAIAALGLIEFGDADAAARTELGAFLTGLLDDSSLADDARAQIPIALGRIDARSALPHLLDLATWPSVGPRFEESVILSLGALAGPRCAGDPLSRAAADALIEKIRTGTNEQARHFAIIALADVAAAALRTDFAGNPEFAHSITEVLLEELTKPKQSAHGSWAGIALSIIGSEYDLNARGRNEIVLRLAPKFASENYPSYQSAYAIALGILNATNTAPMILNVMEQTNSLDLKGYCAIALGMMKHAECKEALHKYVLDDRGPKFRLQVATALARMDDVETTDRLVAMFPGAQTLNAISSLTRAVALIGDSKAIAPLGSLIGDKHATGLSRGFGCMALGLLAEKTDLPWNAKLSISMNYRAKVVSLREALDTL